MPQQPQSSLPLKFGQIVVAPARVRNAFARPAFIRWWWAALLALHGKPTSIVDDQQAALCVANGFRFYGNLYGSLGVALLLGSVLGATIAIPFSVYWPVMGGLLGVHLLAAATVARVGASAYPDRREQGLLLLMLFLGMVAVFLAFFLALASSAAEQLGVIPAWLNVTIVSGLVVIGIGSYAIEAVYLVHVAFGAMSDAEP